MIFGFVDRNNVALNTMEKTNHIETAKGINGFQQLLTKYLPFWPLFLVAMILSGLGLFLYLEYTVPIYETTASVLIKDEKKGQEDSKMEEVLNVFGTKKIVENELEIFHSNSLLVSVVKKLKLYAPIFEQQGWMGLGVSPAYLSCPIIVEVPDPAAIVEIESVYFHFNGDDSTVLIGKEKYKLNEWVKTDFGLVRFQRNPNFTVKSGAAPDSARYFFSLLALDNVTKDLLTRLKVSAASKQASIINLSVKDEVPARAEKIISEIVVAYNNASAERKSGVAMKTLKFIEERLKNVSKELDSVEGSIQKYRDTTSSVDIGAQSKLYLENIAVNDRQASTLNMQLASLDEVEKYVQAKESTGNFVPSTFSLNDPTLTSLLTTLATNEAQYEKLKRTTAENSPIMLSLQEEINKTKPNILDNVRSQRSSIQSALATLQKNSEHYSGILQSVPKKERQLVEVSRQHTIKSDIYSFLLQKREETAYSITSILPDCYMVSNPTTTERPVSPKKPFLAILAFVIALGIPSGWLYAKDSLNGKILYRNDIERLTPFPIIGEVIYEKLISQIVVETSQRSFAVEQFRLIRTAIKHLGTPPGSCKRILISSCIKGDGKSFVSVNLAVSMSRSGKRVALLEMDLHQPKISEIFEIPKGEGITDYLLGKATADAIIIPEKKYPGLSIITTGYLTEDANELLSHGKLGDLLSYLDKQFDYIIVDTAPLVASTDGYIIAPYCDLMLTVVRHNHTPKSFVELINKEMAAHNIKNVAIVFNGVKKRGIGKYSYGYGHGYGYDNKFTYENYGKKKKY